MSRKAIALIALLIIFLVTDFYSLTPVFASNSQPTIEVYDLSSRPTLVKIYVYSTDLDLNTSRVFVCPYHDEIIRTFYEQLLVLRKTIFRFVSEYPKYSKLTEIIFINASSPKEADVTLRITQGTNESGVLMYRIGGSQPNEIQIDCWYPPRTGEDFPSIMLHEIFHSLGVGHASTEHTNRGEPELMHYIDGETYPSTLDLFALYELYFGKIDFKGDYKTSVILPKDLEYRMLIPYDVELQWLKEENEELEVEVSRLQSDLNKLQEELDQANDLITVITQENQRLKDQVSSLRESLENLTRENAGLEQQLAHAQNEVSKLQDEVSSFQEDIVALQTSNDKLQSENQVLKRQLQQANQTILTLSILTICLIAITIAVITFRMFRKS